MSAGFIVALPWEMSTLTNVSMKVGTSISVTENIHVCLSGMGRTNVKQACLQLMDRGVQIFISWGTAAALQDDISTGTLIIPQKIVYKDGAIAEPSRELQKFVKNQVVSYLPYHEGALYAADTLLSKKRIKTDLARQYNVVAADMESGYIADVARDYNIPFVVVRSISDSSDMIIPPVISESVNDDGVLNYRSLMRLIILRPDQWYSMVKLYIGAIKAKKALVRTRSRLSPLFLEGKLQSIFNTDLNTSGQSDKSI